MSIGRIIPYIVENTKCSKPPVRYVLYIMYIQYHSVIQTFRSVLVPNAQRREIKLDKQLILWNIWSKWRQEINFGTFNLYGYTDVCMQRLIQHMHVQFVCKWIWKCVFKNMPRDFNKSCQTSFSLLVAWNYINCVLQAYTCVFGVPSHIYQRLCVLVGHVVSSESLAFLIFKYTYTSIFLSFYLSISNIWSLHIIILCMYAYIYTVTTFKYTDF